MSKRKNVRFDPVDNELEQAINQSQSGLRGLANLGNVCYLNTILQVLCHTPVLKNHFLHQDHDCFFDLDSSRCLFCCISVLCQKMYSSETLPLQPYDVLDHILKKAPHLEGNTQQDAHEAFMIVLTMLSNRSKASPNLNDCEYCIEQSFLGVLRSDLLCTTCNVHSTKLEDFWNISLDLISSEGAGSRDANGNVSFGITLKNCLDGFTAIEMMPNRSCDMCGSDNSSIKQMTLDRLPFIMCFHFKRLLPTHKISSFVSFPERIIIESHHLQSALSSDERNNNSEGRSDNYRGRDDNYRGRDEYSKGRADYTKGRADGAKGGVGYSKGGADGAKGGVGYSKGGADGAKGGAVYSKGGADGAKGGAVYSKGGADYAKGGAGYSKGGADYAKGGACYSKGGAGYLKGRYSKRRNLESPTFKLYAVICHDGDNEQGHYFCYVKENDWYKINDVVVSRVTRDEVLKSEAYMLFYKRSLK